MAKYNIKDADGNILNTIVASPEFVEENFEFYEEVEVSPALSNEQIEIIWRNKELDNTDKYMAVSDYPEANRAAMANYRQRLRDWPSTPEFPYIRPTLEPVIEQVSEQ